MAPEPSIGVVFPARTPVETLPSFAASAEQRGLHEVWVVEDCFLSGGIAMAATALAATEHVRVGIGLLPAAVRNPAIAAMELATLSRLHGGRVAAAIGHGVAAWMRQIDAHPQNRLGALEEVASAVRALLRGDTVTATGSHVRLEAVALEAPPQARPPILVGTTGPRGLAVAGRVADGILLPEGCGPAFIRWALKQAGGGAPQEGDALECVVYAWLRIDDDEERARLALRPAVDQWLASGLYPHPLRLAGGDSRLEPGAVPDALAREVAVVGDPLACARAIGELARSGAHTVAFIPVGDDVEGQLDRLAGEVLPLLATRGARW